MTVDKEYYLPCMAQQNGTHMQRCMALWYTLNHTIFRNLWEPKFINLEMTTQSVNKTLLPGGWLYLLLSRSVNSILIHNCTYITVIPRTHDNLNTCGYLCTNLFTFQPVLAFHIQYSKQFPLTKNAQSKKKKKHYQMRESMDFAN